MQEMEVEFLKTEKGKEALILDGFKYCFQRKNQDEKTAWRCAKYWTNNCKAAVLTKHGKVVKTTQGELMTFFFYFRKLSDCCSA